MPPRTFSEKAANQFLHKAFRAPPGDETVAMLAKDWRAVAESHFAFTPDQRKVLEAIDPASGELIQSTLTTALARRRTNPQADLQIHFVEAPPTQTRPVEVRVERGTVDNGSFNASDGSSSLTDSEVAQLIFYLGIALGVFLECFTTD